MPEEDLLVASLMDGQQRGHNNLLLDGSVRYRYVPVHAQLHICRCNIDDEYEAEGHDTVKPSPAGT